MNQKNIFLLLMKTQGQTLESISFKELKNPVSFIDKEINKFLIKNEKVKKMILKIHSQLESSF